MAVTTADSAAARRGRDAPGDAPQTAFWDGHGLLAAWRHAAAVLHSRLDEVNALNVFPVPDGDTGSNMLATVRAAITEAEAVAPSERTIKPVSTALSLGALMGARGNSGVILSQLIRGFGEALGTVERVTGRELAAALTQGCEVAYSAVAVPVEGTILTVAHDAADAARAGAAGSEDDGALARVLDAASQAAAASVERTPSLLPVLAQAGVVDAGGRGLQLLLLGMLASVQGSRVAHGTPLPYDLILPTWDGPEADGYGYETVFVVLPFDGEALDVAHIRTRLERLGESVLVAGDERAIKIHIHNERPDEVLAFGLSLGSLSRISIENLDRQATDVRERARSAAEHGTYTADEHPVHAGPRVIAVAAGDGLARVFGTLGVSAVVRGGQTANPSTGELAEAIRSSGGDEVIVLPNNPNVRLAARQAAQLVPGVKVTVVPTRNAAEGVAAMLAFDPDASVRETARRMIDAAKRVQTLQATVAVRDARIGNKKVHRGDFIVLGPNDGLVAADADRSVAVLQAMRQLQPGFELVTVYRGLDVEHRAAEELRDSLAAELGDVEIELVEGGQPHYDFLIAAE